MSPKRLTRKEIKEDPIKDALGQLYDGLARNTKYWLGAILVVAVGAAVFYAWQVFSAGRSDEVQQRFAEALEIYHAPLNDEVPAEGDKPKYQFATAEERNNKALEAFSSLAEEQGGSGVGEFARYYSALVRHELGQDAKAKEDLQTLIANGPEPEIAALARNYLAYLHSVDGETEQAIAVWKAMLDNPPEKFPLEGILANLAEAYEAVGNKEEALVQYRRLVAEFPQNADFRKHQSKVEFLEAELEAAGKTPEAPEPAPKDSGA